MFRRRALTFAALAVLASPAAAQNFSNVWFFGDSNTDSGRYLYLSGPQGFAPPGAGTYTTNPDAGWAASLSGRFGLGVTPQDAPGGGNNYAAGGARVSFTGANPNVWSATNQVNAYLAMTGGVADPNALYTVWIGVNDLKTTTTGGMGNIVFPEDTAAITTLGQQTAGLVGALAAAGARYFLIPNTISFMNAAASAAAGNVYGPGAMASTASRALYDQVVWNTVHAMGINFIPADFNSIYNYVLVNPAPFGITTTSLATGACGAVNSYQCTPANYVTPNANQTYFYADGTAASDGGGHLSGAMQKVEADYYYGLITAPSVISFLAEAPLKTRANVVNSILNQIPLSFGQVGAFHGWVSGDVSWLKIDNYTGFPDDPGTPVAVTAGFDYRISSDWLAGMAFSGATTKQTFSAGGGFRQEEFAISAYGAYRHDPFWFDAIATWGALRDNVDRQIPLGITVQSNQGDTSGSNISFAAEGGYNFITRLGTTGVSGMPGKAPPAAIELTHGPVLGIVLQQVRIGAYTETNPAGVPTALSFDSQLRNSAVTELGYQASLTLGIWQPFAKAVWNHELVDKERDVTAALTSIIAPSYFMPAVVLGRDWGTGTLGTRIKLSPTVAAYAAAIGQIGQSNVVTYGGQVGLNAAF
jgi:outer membrane lipase/esterase